MFTQVIVAASVIGATAFVAPKANGARSMKMAMEDRSVALPMDRRPPNLDGTLPGDFGFDPAGFSNNPPQFWGVKGSPLKWYREAELMHGRIAQLAVVGNLFPAWAHWAGNSEVGLDAYAEINPLKALSTVPAAALWQIAAFIFVLETLRIKRVLEGDKEAGDHGLGQGAFNPFQFNYSPEEYREKQVQEIKHSRLAMFGALGMLLQNANSGKGVVEQLGEAFTWPDDRAILNGMGTLGDYFPPNI
jgi:Chlorophyll A-B binding protein